MLPQQLPTAAFRGASAPTEAHSENDEFYSRYPDCRVPGFWSSGFIKKLSMSLFARSTRKTAARAGVSFRAETGVAPLRTFQTTAIRKDEASKEHSIHVVHNEKGQRREKDIEVDETKSVINGGA